jgi:tripartite ATP-independent transporter DctP family solute receptor
MKSIKKIITAMGCAMMVSSMTVSAATTFSIGHGANENYHLHRALEKFKDEVESKTEGRFDINIYPSSQLGPDREMIESVQSGVLQMAVSPSSFYTYWDQAFDVIELPFIYPSKEVALNTVHGQAGDKMLERLADLNLVGLGWFENGVRHVTNNKRPIHEPKDLDGIKIRTMKVPAHVETFNTLGANATPMNFGEVYSGLQQGVIDGQENPVAHIFSQRFFEVQDYMSLTGHVFTFYIPVISLDFWNTLSDADKEIFRNAIHTAENYQQDLINSEEASQLDEIKKAGVKVNTLSPEEINLFVENTESVRESFRDKVGSDIYSNWMTAIKEAQ